MSLLGVRERGPKVALAGGLILAAALGLAVTRLDATYWGISEVLLLVLGMLLLVPFVVTLLRGRRIDFLEPINVVVLGYALFLLVRPIYILAFDDLTMINFLGGRPELIPVALLHAILGLAALYVGYYGPVGKTIAQALPATGERVSPMRLRNWGLLLIVVGTLLYGVFLSKQDVSAASAFEGSTAYFYLGIDVVGVGVLLLFYWALRSPRWRRILLVAALILGFFLLATNLANRYRMLYLGFALLASYYLLRNKRIRPTNMLVLLPPSLAYIGVVGLIRGGGGAEGKITLSDLSKVDLQAVWQRFFSSTGDLNIFDTYVRIITAFPDIYPYLAPGRTFGYLFVAFVPRTLWPGKPDPTEKFVNLYMIGDYGTVKADGGGYAYSLLGSFYVEGGIIAVLVGMMIFGILCRMVWSYHTKHNNVGSKLVLAITLPAILLAQRGGFNDNDAVWYLTYLVPALVGLRYAAHRRSRAGEKGATKV